MNLTQSKDTIGASVTRGSGHSEQMSVSGRYRMECLGPNGEVKWTEEFDNLVTGEGKKFLLDSVFPAGAGTGATTNVNMFYRMAIITANVAANASATYSSFAGTYEELGKAATTHTSMIASRVTPTFSAASGTTSGVKATTSATTGTLGTGTATVHGVAIVVVSASAVGALGTISDTGTTNAKLYSVGLFTDGGGVAKSVSTGDTLNVTYTTTLS